MASRFVFAPSLALALATLLPGQASAEVHCQDIANPVWCSSEKCCAPSFPVCCADGQHCGLTQLHCSCASEGKVVCGNGCIPEGSVCCSDGSYCPAGTQCDSRCGCLPAGATCCSDGTYCQDGKECNCKGCTDPGAVCCDDGSVCPQGKECGCGGCMDEGAICCGNNTFCQSGRMCCGSGCAPAGGVCCGSFACGSGQVCCGNGCMPAGSVCCTSGYCPSGTSCDGSMCRGPSQTYTGYTCPSGYPKLCSAGTPFCCPDGTSCGTNECILNYQPPPGSSQTPGSGYKPSPGGKPSPSGDPMDPNSGWKPAELKWGCSATSGGFSWLALAAVSGAWVLRRRHAVGAVVLVAAVGLSAPAPAAEPCPAGQKRSADTEGNCCWPDQAWSKLRKACVGIPRCPAKMKVEGESCAFDCEPGKTVTEETAGNCCWPAQVWSKSRGKCVGIPACPGGWTASGEECLAQGAALPAPPPPTVQAQPVTPAQPAIQAQPLVPAPAPVVAPPPAPPVLAQPAAVMLPVAPVQPLPPPVPAAQPATPVQPLPPPVPAEHAATPVQPLPPAVPAPAVIAPQPQQRPVVQPVRRLDEPPPYEPVYNAGARRVQVGSSEPTAAAAEATAKPSYKGLRWFMELEFVLDAASKYPGGMLRLDIPFGTKHVFALGAGVGILGQVEGTGTKLLVIPIPIRLSYRIPVGDTGLQIIPLLEAVPNFLVLGKAEKWGAKVGGGLKLHYGRLSSGPGVNLGCEILGIDGTVALVTLGLAL